MARKNIVERRPTEVTTGVAASIAYLAARVFGLIDEPEIVLHLSLVIGWLPAGITWVVEKIRYDG